MSDLDLREALSDLADEVIITDLVPRVQHRLVVRRRRRIISAAVATLLILGGTAAAVGSARNGDARRLPPAEKPTPSPSTTATPAPSNPRQLTTSVTPHYLPDGATLLRTGPLESSNGQQLTTPDHPPISSSYQLAGHVNSNTMPGRALTESEARDRHYHPATTLEILFVPQAALPREPTGGQDEILRRILPPAQARFGFTRKSVTIGGNYALITSDNKLGGAFRIDWIDPAGYHSVSCDRIITDEGLSGLPPDILLRVARSLYSPTSPDAAE